MVYETSGYLVAATRQTDYKATEISPSVNVPTSTQIDVTVYQDYSGGASADNSETLTDVASTTYSLSNFETAQGSTYWVRFDLSTSDDSVTPTVNEATVVADGLELSADFVGTLSGSGTLSRSRELSASVEGSLSGSGTLYRVGPVYATTELPNVTVDDITPIDASIEDELTVQSPQVSDYGDVRAQIRVSGSGNNYGDDVVVAHDGGDFTFADLLDGEKYDLRARTETEHVTGSWAGVSAVTLLPADTNFTNTDREI